MNDDNNRRDDLLMLILTASDHIWSHLNTAKHYSKLGSSHRVDVFDSILHCYFESLKIKDGKLEEAKRKEDVLNFYGKGIR